MQRIFGIMIAIVLMSCTTTTQPTAVGTPAPTTTADVNADIAVHAARWRAAGIRNYRFQLTVSCYCPMNAMMPITVDVRDGAVVTMTDANGKAVSPAEAGSDFFMKYTTIDGIYAELTSARFSKADKLTITYDPTYGFPSAVSADFIEMAADDELYLGISGFAISVD